jgi:hypothetical protein
MVMKKNILFRNLDMAARDAERRVRRIRNSTNNKPIGDEILQRKRTIAQLGARVTDAIISPRSMPVNGVKIKLKKTTD